MGGNFKGMKFNYISLFIPIYQRIISFEIFFVGRGNSLKAAEFNFFADPEAAHIVLDSLNRPITIVPLECGHEESISIPMV